MTFIKAALLVIVFASFTSLFVTRQTYAAQVFQICDSTAGSTDVCHDVKSQQGKTTDPVISTLKIVINVLSLIIGVAAVIMIIVAGLRMILSAGDPNTITSARNSIIYACVGILIAVIAQSLVVFVLDRIT